MKTAYATIKGFEVMRMIRKRQCILLVPGIAGEVRFVAKPRCSGLLRANPIPIPLETKCRVTR
jgi:hypothetical protein